MSDKVLIQVPFSGFYESIHDSEMNSALEQMFSDSSGCEVYRTLHDQAFDLVEWSSVHCGYAKEFVECFATEFELESLEYEGMRSPKYYNFETDRIFGLISLSDVQKMFDSVDKDQLEQHIAASFTSYDGFISHYPNSLSEWPDDLKEWDHNHLATLLEVYIASIDPEYDAYKEYDIVENPSEIITNLVCENSKDGMDRLFNIGHYLRTREERAYR